MKFPGRCLGRRQRMSGIREVLENSRKVVIKIGSNVLSTDDGMPNKANIYNIVDQVCQLIEQGKQVIVVSSGAAICGVGAINKWSRRKDIHYKQALCAIGQVELMMEYKNRFATHDVHVGQMLLTRGDFTNDERRLHIRNTLFTLVDEGVVPIINENDSVSVDEIKIGDNDTLSALAGSLWNTDALIILSDINGVYDKDPKTNPDAQLIEEITDIDELIKKIEISGTSSFGTGGIATKIEAARRAGEYGISTILLNGRKNNIILDAMEDKEKGTVFIAEEI